MDNIIEKLIFEFSLSNTNESFELEASLDGLYDKLLRELDDVFNTVIPANEVILVDRLVIDLDFTNVAHFRANLIEQVKNLMTKKISTTQRESIQYLQQQGIDKKTVAELKINILKEFIQDGFVNSMYALPSGLEMDDLFVEVIQSKENLKEILGFIAKNPSYQDRVFMQMSAQSILEMIRLIHKYKIPMERTFLKWILQKYLSDEKKFPSFLRTSKNIKESQKDLIYIITEIYKNKLFSKQEYQDFESRIASFRTESWTSKTKQSETPVFTIKKYEEFKEKNIQNIENEEGIQLVPKEIPASKTNKETKQDEAVKNDIELVENNEKPEEDKITEKEKGKGIEIVGKENNTGVKIAENEKPEEEKITGKRDVQAMKTTDKKDAIIQEKEDLTIKENLKEQKEITDEIIQEKQKEEATKIIQKNQEEKVEGKEDENTAQEMKETKVSATEEDKISIIKKEKETNLIKPVEQIEHQGKEVKEVKDTEVKHQKKDENQVDENEDLVLENEVLEQAKNIEAKEKQEQKSKEEKQQKDKIPITKEPQIKKEFNENEQEIFSFENIKNTRFDVKINDDVFENFMRSLGIKVQGKEADKFKIINNLLLNNPDIIIGEIQKNKLKIISDYATIFYGIELETIHKTLKSKQKENIVNYYNILRFALLNQPKLLGLLNLSTLLYAKERTGSVKGIYLYMSDFLEQAYRYAGMPVSTINELIKKALDLKGKETTAIEEIKNVILVKDRNAKKKGGYLKKLEKIQKQENKSPSYKKIGDGIYVHNAGLVLLWPFLSRYFSMAGLFKKGTKEFLNHEARCKAVFLTEFLVTKRTTAPENELVLNKIICGIPIDMPIPAEVEFSQEEKDMGDSLLRAVVSQWKATKNTSPDSLRGGFLIREGKVTNIAGEWNLVVEQKTLDVLIKKLPWSFTMIKLPWLNKLIHVEW